MKKFLLLAVITAYAVCAGAQDDQQYMYCQLLGYGSFFGTKVTVDIDYGQAAKFFDNKRIKDETGKIVKFNSMVDAMNYMGTDGWEFVQAYVITKAQQNVYHWLLKKRIDNISKEDRDQMMNKLNTDADQKRSLNLDKLMAAENTEVDTSINVLNNFDIGKCSKCITLNNDRWVIKGGPFQSGQANIHLIKTLPNNITIGFSKSGAGCYEENTEVIFLFKDQSVMKFRNDKANCSYFTVVENDDSQELNVLFSKDISIIRVHAANSSYDIEFNSKMNEKFQNTLKCLKFAEFK